MMAARARCVREHIPWRHLRQPPSHEGMSPDSPCCVAPRSPPHGTLTSSSQLHAPARLTSFGDAASAGQTRHAGVAGSRLCNHRAGRGGAEDACMLSAMANPAGVARRIRDRGAHQRIIRPDAHRQSVNVERQRISEFVCSRSFALLRRFSRRPLALCRALRLRRRPAQASRAPRSRGVVVDVV
jgi:hypothetical protein